jgi:hypothetical protein
MQVSIHVHVGGQDAGLQQVTQHIDAFLFGKQFTIPIWLQTHLVINMNTILWECYKLICDYLSS